MVKARSSGSKLQPLKGSIKKTRKISKSSGADVGKTLHLPNSETPNKNNPNGGPTDPTSSIAYSDQTPFNDTGIANVPALTETHFEDEGSINNYSHKAVTDSVVETSIDQLETPHNRNAANPQSNTTSHEVVQTSVSTETHHTGEDNQDWVDSDEMEANEYQLGLWAYGTSSDSITVAERLEKLSWTCAREERL
ncbi:hypothetical protein IFR05_011506 [Cadophora sp. M221]|nr:hypothetical protein IFR05_011506 [Cadophora sp. M221]